MKKYDFAGLNERLLPEALGLLEQWLPGGKLRGREYICGGPGGGEGHSLSVNVDTGVWSEFATGDAGRDLISLYAYLFCNNDQGEAFRQLNGEAPTERSTRNNPPRKKEDDLQLGVPPDGAAMPEIPGSPSQVFTYRTAGGSPLHIIALYREDGGKRFCPWTWSAAKGKWVPKAYPRPRPLYNQHLLEKHPDARVMIVEGEKCADALATVCLPKYVPVTWPGGSKAWRYADWRPLAGRKICLWPDADEAGIEAMRGLAEALNEQSIEIKAFNVKDMPEKWDAADAIADGWDWKRILGWGKPLIYDVKFQAKNTARKKNELPSGLKRTSELRVGAYDYWTQLGIEIADKGGPVRSLLNATNALEGWKDIAGKIWWDSFHEQIYTTWGCDKRQWKDEDYLRIAHYFQNHLRLPFEDELMKKAVRLYAFNHDRNEVQEWLAGLEWDGNERIPYVFTDCFGADDSTYVMQASQNFFLSIAARITQPGCQVDNMVIFEGKQGTFKSTALRTLGGPWYASVTDCVNSKDFMISIRGKILVEIGEMDAFGKADIQRIKNIVSNPSDRYRSPYDTHSKDHPRQCVFSGTTNEEHYLRDHTGGRRFWPISCGLIDVDQIAANREQYFAEAAFKVKDGAKWYEMPEETFREQERRRQQEPWEDIISEWLVSHEMLEGSEPLTTSLIMGDCLKMEPSRWEYAHSLRIGRAMKALGYKTVVRHIDGKSSRVYVLDKEEGNANPDGDSEGATT